VARKEEAEALIRSGLTPSEAARQMAVSVATVVQYLRLRVGEGELRFSEIYFYLPAEKREVVEMEIKGHNPPTVLETSIKVNFCITPDDIRFYKSLRTRSTFAGDLYEYVSEIEIALHDLVSRVLRQAFGEEESGYWRKGVSVAIRKKCQERREGDEEPCDFPLQYTTLIELSQVIGDNWTLFQQLLPTEYRSNRKVLTTDFARLNWIRNAVMHPVKRRRWSESDFQFAAKLHEAFKHYRVI
jgi:hypothetical protein